MGNWLNYKRFILFFILITLAFQWPEEAHHRWGFYGHQRINRIAVFTLPPELIGFFKEHIEFITEHAVDPDKRRYVVEGEAACHFIDLDHYYHPGEDPFLLIPKSWKDAVEKYSEDTLMRHGIVPWHICSMKFKLQKAFENENVDLILKYASEIGHYIGDAHVPLHTTKNYNGQYTGQRGIHGLWESRLVELHAEDYNYFVGRCHYIDNVNSFAWKSVKSSHELLDSVLKIEKTLSDAFPSDRKYSIEQRGNMSVSVYSKEYADAYHTRLNKMVERRMREAIIGIGSIWYTAWVDAGQPDMNKLRNIPLSMQLLRELETLDHQATHDGHKTSICD
jgi:hypothetical protein